MSNKPSAKPITLFLLSSLFVWHLLLLSVTAKEVELFVSPNGNDNWSGRLAQANIEITDGPLATLAAARAAMRKVGAEKQRRIILQAGEYFLETPLVLDTGDNGLEIAAETEKSKGGVSKGNDFLSHTCRKLKRATGIFAC